ncbi:MAG: hypothetical protein QCI38_02800, partial [Candidatus Thermoplasmatota archaeon]|nr:hypothetical protein [Candidatus Thermoplasmatota archaeon]
PSTDTIVEGKQAPGLTIMAVDNLPAELPREASVRFSKSLEPFVYPIAKADYSVSFEKLELPPEIKKAVIIHKGELTPDYKYMVSYL